MNLLNYNGTLFPENTPLVSANNRSFRYGDGFFETMKMINGRIALLDHHFDRLFKSLEELEFDSTPSLTPALLEKAILELAQKNQHTAAARVRLMIFRDEGGLYDLHAHAPHYIIQTSLLPSNYQRLNKDGLTIGFFSDARKAFDRYSPIKTNSYLHSVMASLWAKRQNLDDAIILNANERVAETSIANIFIVQDGIVKTPALTEACVAGVMRRHLLQCLVQGRIVAEESPITTDDIASAEEVFLSNAAYGIRWVKQCGKNMYQNTLAAEIYDKYVSTL